jgi:hypothetical protein
MHDPCGERYDLWILRTNDHWFSIKMVLEELWGMGFCAPQDRR